MTNFTNRTAAPPPVDGILDAIGTTPLVRMRNLFGPAAPPVYAKLEALNPGGSAKDRPAVRMLADALVSGELRAGGTVVESTSGNLGVGLAQACAGLGLRLVCVVDPRISARNLRTLRAMGARVEMVTEPDPASGDLLVARLTRVAELVRSIPGAYWPNQYANPSNAAATGDGTMREIAEALDGDVGTMLVATSTTGTLVGCADRIRAEGLDTHLVAVDAVGSALFGGVRGPRLLPGFGAGVETPLSLAAHHDRLVRVSDLDCVVGCRRMAGREGYLPGASGGGVVSALASILDEVDDRPCVMLLADGGASYLETAYDDAWVEAELGVTPAELAERVRADLMVEGRAG